jgi:hypothetical protein
MPMGHHQSTPLIHSKVEPSAGLQKPAGLQLASLYCNNYLSPSLGSEHISFIYSFIHSCITWGH